MPEIQGHRICGRLSVENSRAAVHKVKQLGFINSIEFDVRSTKCGQLVVAHGPEHNEGGVKVEDFTYNELLTALTLPNGETVPLFTDIIDPCILSGIIMNIEIKEFDESLIVCLLHTLKHKSALHLCRISSFKRAVLETVRKLEPLLPLGCLYNDTIAINAGLALRQPSPDDMLHFHLSLGVRQPFDSVNLCAETVTREEVAACHSAGLKVLVWFPSDSPPHLSDDSPDNILRIASLGVDVICTNRPDLAALSLCLN